ncbi:MAG: hypothetical protein HGA75_15890, partial [Thiobacillus sp.]|nr:hypothetical protein [Thiobacillus sp.]
MTYALQTTSLVKKFGGFVATNTVSLNVEAGARHALIGPNGAGLLHQAGGLQGVSHALAPPLL